MKKIIFYLLPTILSLTLVWSCKLDNYDAPDAALSGSIIDLETGELIQSDIIEGTTIRITEHGYDPVAPQYLRVKNDGTYANTLLFSNTYSVRPEVRNFIQIDEQEVQIGKDTKLDFYVTPYLRLKDVSFTTEGNTIIASFRIEQTTADAVARIGLFASDQPIVGEPVRTVASERNINRVVSPDEEFRIGINVAQNTKYLKRGGSYFFRVGAISGFPGAKYNYAPAERMEIGEIVPEQEPKSQVLDDCETTTGWGGSNPISLDDDAQQGDHSVKAAVNAGGVVIFQKTYDTPFDTEVSKENGYLAFSLYVSDISQINWDTAGPSIEITSGANPDSQELSWNFDKSLRLQNGWNEVRLPLATANVVGGNINLRAVNFFRIFHLAINGSLEMKIDNIRFYEQF
jgi:hypothetical protein